MIAIYVPVAGHRDVVDIVRGSGIVGEPWDDSERLLIDFEGNVYGAENLKRYVERVNQAWGRHESSYPTVARRAVKKEALVQVGWFDPAEGVVSVFRGTEWIALMEWLGVDRVEPSEMAL